MSRDFSGIPIKGDRSETFVPERSRNSNGIPLSGARSEIGNSLRSRCFKGIPRKGVRSDTFVLLRTRYSSCIPLSGEISATGESHRLSDFKGIPVNGDRSETEFFGNISFSSGKPRRKDKSLIFVSYKPRIDSFFKLLTGEKSVTQELEISSRSSGISCRGDRSHTWVSQSARRLSSMPSSAEISTTFFPLSTRSISTM